MSIRRRLQRLRDVLSGNAKSYAKQMGAASGLLKARLEGKQTATEWDVKRIDEILATKESKPPSVTLIFDRSGYAFDLDDYAAYDPDEPDKFRLGPFVLKEER